MVCLGIHCKTKLEQINQTQHCNNIHFCQRFSNQRIAAGAVTEILILRNTRGQVLFTGYSLGELSLTQSAAFTHIFI